MPSVPIANGIFSATYSNVPVFEFNAKGTSVMRRRSDDYINATHILKVCDYDKPSRTRILERDVQKGIHEKVQGGYGKYQGTWIPLKDGAVLAERNGVYDILAPIFEFQFQAGARSPPPAPKHVTAASQKPKVPKQPAAKKQKTQQRMPAAPKNDGPYYDGSSMQYDDSPDRSSVIPPSDIGDDEYPYYPRGNHIRKRKREEDAMIQEQETEWTYFADSLLDHFAMEMSLEAPPIPPDYPMDRPIDDQRHTVLHWAAAMGEPSTVQAFLERGANPMIRNIRGETPAMRAVLFTNNYEHQSLHTILQMLEAPWEHTDKYGGTLLHHIAMTTSSANRRYSARYYFGVICNQMKNDLLPHEYDQILNAQDQGGNTALHIVARQASKKNIKTLIALGARSDISDCEGQTVDQILGKSRSKLANPAQFPLTSSPLHGDGGDRRHGITSEALPVTTRRPVSSSHHNALATTKSAQSFSSSFSETIPSKGLQLSLAMDAESSERDAALTESQTLVKNTLDELVQVRKQYNALQEELQRNADDHFRKNQLLEVEKTRCRSFLEMLTHAQLHEDVGGEEAAVPEEAIQQPQQSNGVVSSSTTSPITSTSTNFNHDHKENTLWDQLRAAHALAITQSLRRSLTAQVVDAYAAAGGNGGSGGSSSKGESMMKLIAATINLPVETVPESVPDLLEQLKMDGVGGNNIVAGQGGMGMGMEVGMRRGVEEGVVGA